MNFHERQETAWENGASFAVTVTQNCKSQFVMLEKWSIATANTRASAAEKRSRVAVLLAALLFDARWYATQFGNMQRSNKSSRAQWQVADVDRKCEWLTVNTGGHFTRD